MFQFLAIINKAFLKTYMYRFFCKCKSVSVGCIPGNINAGSYENCMFSFLFLCF